MIEAAVVIVILIVLIYSWKWGLGLAAIALAAHARIQSRFDYVVVGGGISGLLAAYRIKKADPRRSVLVCEADRWGGRAYSYDWHGALIKLGAGIIRGRDHKLLALCKELGLKVGQFNSTVSYRWKDPKPLSQAEIPGWLNE